MYRCKFKICFWVVFEQNFKKKFRKLKFIILSKL